MNPTATEIESWANTRDAQGLLPILIRRLIHNSVSNVESIRFPGGDSVLLGGFDGELSVAQGNAWIPNGVSPRSYRFTHPSGLEAQAKSRSTAQVR